MPKTYYDSELTGAQIESALEAIHGVVTPSNNGKVLYIDNGQIKAASASRWGHGAVLEPLSVTQNGDYTPPTGTDGFDEVHVAVPSATLTTKSITQNGTYNASSDNVDGYSSVTVNVSGGGSAVVQPLSITQNGTYNPPSGVDGYAPVTVNVSGGTSYFQVKTPNHSGLAYCYIDRYSGSEGFWTDDSGTANLAFYEVGPGDYVAFAALPVGTVFRMQFFAGKTYADFEPYISAFSSPKRKIFSPSKNITGMSQEQPGNFIAGANISSSGVIVIETGFNSTLVDTILAKIVR